MDRRQRLIEIFEDTQRFYSQNPQLSKAAQAAKTATKLYEENDPLGELAGKGSEGQIAVSKHKTFEAAMQLHAEHSVHCRTASRI
jgi:hypothetical protein